ncbi:MAG: vitamin B12 dependent-methionine synthase activation domain-containing protein [Candidatus Thorarchaeota archaeon]
MIVSLFPDFQLNNKEIISLLGRRKKKVKTIDTSYLNLIEELKETSKNFIQPKAIYKIFDQNHLPIRASFEEAEKIVLAICTIGENLPNQVNSFIEKNELVKAVILDAIGSVIVEKVADYINHQINLEAQKLKLEFGSRYSPGYCSWETKDQKLIFDNLSGNEIGVCLTDSLMMKPIKSISFAVNLGHDIAKTRWENRCRLCEQKMQCSYKLS